MIIADENIEQYWITLLRERRYEVFSIREEMAGISDYEVAQLTRNYVGILLTEDKDFGEMVFAHGIKGMTILFLRYEQPLYDQIRDAVLDVIEAYYNQEACFFITITPGVVRIRNI